jgi:hypothetical protein
MSSNSAENNGFLRAIKIRSTPSFRGEVKPFAPCRKILQHVKNPFKYDMRYLVRQNLTLPSAVTSALLLDHSADITAREIWWSNQEFSAVNIIPPWVSMLIYHLGDEQ